MVVIGKNLLGGGAGTTRDTFELLYQAEKYGARVALFGRKILGADSPLDIVRLMRAVADGKLKPLEAVREYHAELKKKKIVAARSIEEDSKVTEAALKEAAERGGFVLAMMCDLRFMAEEANLTTVFSKRGLIAEHGTSWLLPRMVGLSRAMDLLWSSRKVSAAEAYRIGLADRVLPAGELIDAVAAYVDEMAATVSPRAIAVIKAAVHRHLETGFDAAALDAEALMQTALKHPDATEGAMSFIERRPPQFAAWTGDEG